MKCENCGSLLMGTENFCKNCGAPVSKVNVQNNVGLSNQNFNPMVGQQLPNNNVVTPQVNNYQQQYNTQTVKSNNTKFVFIGVGLAIIIVLFVIISGLSFGSEGSSLIANTRWVADDNSEVIFSIDRIDWYKDASVHTDNYYSGKYKFYIGEEAVEYITEELEDYGVTESELESLFSRNEKYNESNFVVFDIRYDEFIMNGKSQTISRPLVPWYGFILEDNTVLDVVNMNTAAYYKFTKQ